ncbi:hypothetical protein MUY27_01330 [Mucilaginibacter sp. RS28]|uniref:Adhesin n=1 Tax=Mucilaginibacter straminoryzae TaxID=2932774 RepID=A0A9X1X1J9_9SPHI|nr:hypothetical protein [Mucilaginibacter straminoryzae]MCJ8208330.1 hypothetical protein [Mucilaginibacter straminoryzae]
MEQYSTQQNQSRDQLKDYFKNGKVPTEIHYAALINSMVHKTEDGFSKDRENGLKVYNQKANKNLLSFYSDINEIDPYYQIAKDEADPSCLKFQPHNSLEDDPDSKSFYFNVQGGLGIGKKAEDHYKLEVAGFAAMEGRIGTFIKDRKPADGKWHTIVEGLDNCNAFEVVARAGKKGTGKFSMMHAIAVSAYGRSGGKIKKVSSCFGFFWNKLNLRWRGTTHDYSLQIRTNTNYGPEAYAYYTLTKLWDDQLFPADRDVYK